MEVREIVLATRRERLVFNFLYSLSHTCAQPVIGQYLYSEMYVNLLTYTVQTHLSGLGMAKCTHHPLDTCNISEKYEEIFSCSFSILELLEFSYAGVADILESWNSTSASSCGKK